MATVYEAEGNYPSQCRILDILGHLVWTTLGKCNGHAIMLQPNKPRHHHVDRSSFPFCPAAVCIQAGTYLSSA